MLFEINDNAHLMWKNKDGFVHREDGPAVIETDGSLYYYDSGLLHRDNKPAIIKPNEAYYYYERNRYYRPRNSLGW